MSTQKHNPLDKLPVLNESELSRQKAIRGPRGENLLQIMTTEFKNHLGSIEKWLETAIDRNDQETIGLCLHQFRRMSRMMGAPRLEQMTIGWEEKLCMGQLLSRDDLNLLRCESRFYFQALDRFILPVKIVEGHAPGLPGIPLELISLN